MNSIKQNKKQFKINIMKKVTFFWTNILMGIMVLCSSGISYGTPTIGDGSKENPYTIPDVNALKTSSSPVWVIGYIIGANDNKLVTSGTNSNIVLATTAEINAIATPNTITIKFANGSIKNDLNIVDNANNIGKKVKIQGKIEAYFSNPGIKTINAYEWVNETPSTSCGNPTALSIGTMSTNFANLSWSEPTVDIPTSYAVHVFNTSLSKNIYDTVKTTSYLCSNLTANTPYDWSVTSICSPTLGGTTVNGSTFTTPSTGTTLSINNPTNGSSINTPQIAAIVTISDLPAEASNLKAVYTLANFPSTTVSTATASATTQYTMPSVFLYQNGLYTLDVFLEKADGSLLATANSITFTVNAEKTQKVVFSPEGGTFYFPTEVSLSCPTADASIRYTTDDNTPSEASTLYSTPININATTTLKALAYKTGLTTQSDSISFTTYTILNLDNISAATLPFSFDGKSSDLLPTKGFLAQELGNDYTSSPYLKFESTNNKTSSLLLKIASAPESLSFNIKANGNGAATTFIVESSTDAKSFSPLATYTMSELSSSATTKTLSLNKDVRWIRWTYAEKGTFTNIALGKIEVNALPLPNEKSINVDPSTLEISTLAENVVKETVVVRGKNLGVNVAVNLLNNTTLYSINKSNLDFTKVNSANGDTLILTYKGAVAGKDTAIVVFSNSELEISKYDTLKVYGTTIALNKVPNIAALYQDYNQIDPKKIYQITGEVFVTHTEATASQVWIQDTTAQGRSILIYSSNKNINLDCKVGDGLVNLTGSLQVYNNLLEFIPFQSLNPANSTNNVLWIDTLPLSSILRDPLASQNKLICLKEVEFIGVSGNMAASKSYKLVQGNDTLVFRTNFKNADYIGKAFPSGLLYITGILSQYKADAQFTARNSADMVKAPCMLPSDFNASSTAATTSISWLNSAKSYKFRYAANQADLSTAKDTTLIISSINLADLMSEHIYYYQVQSLCDASSESAWSAVQTFTTLSALSPSLSIIAPLPNATLTEAVTFTYNTENFVLGTDGYVKIVVDKQTLITDKSTCVFSLTSGNYSATLSLIQKSDSSALTKPVSVSIDFIVDLPNADAPTFQPQAGFYTEAQNVSIHSNTNLATIYYTTDGSLPCATSTKYSKPFVVNTTTTVKAIACKENMDSSSISIATYDIVISPTPVGKIVFQESFDLFSAGGANDTANSTNIADKLDAYTSTPGWTGVNVYQAGKSAKMGGSSKLGYIKTPSLDLSADSGRFYITFRAMAWKGDATTLKLIINQDTTEVGPLSNTSSYTFRDFVFFFDKKTGNTNTTISFVGNQTNKSRFFIDSLLIYQVRPEVTTPTIHMISSLNITTIQSIPVEKTVTVNAELLTENLSISSDNTHFTVSPTSINKDSAMLSKGAIFTLTYDGKNFSDSANITVASAGAISKILKVKATADSIFDIANLSELRQSSINGYYRVKNTVILTAQQSYGNQKWLQDSAAGILVYDRNGIITSTYSLYDGFQNISGKLTSFKGQLQFEPLLTFGAPTSTGNKVEPILISVSELNSSISKYESRLIRIQNVNFASVGTFKSNTDYVALVGNDTFNFRTFIRDANYIDSLIPTQAKDIVAIVGSYSGKAQIAARSLADILDISVPPIDTCAIPTNLKVSNLSQTGATLSWNGNAISYEVILSNPLDTSFHKSQIVSATSCNFSGLTAITTYAWKVRSICETPNVSAFAIGENFITLPLSKENLNQEMQVEIYPNPSLGTFSLTLPCRATIEFFNLSGQLIKTCQLPQGKSQIDLNKSGVYFLRAYSTDGKSTVKRVIVQ